MTELDRKINQHFPGLVVRKDLVKLVKGNAIVPSYVLEYLLGQYCATDDEASIQSGVETVKEILRKHYVHRNEAGLVRSTIREKGRHKVIDKISVDLNDKKDVYEASFSNLGIKQVLVSPDVVKRHPKLLVSGVWCIADLEYMYSEDKNVSPFVMETIKPIQLSHFDYETYLSARRQFTTEEWIDLLLQSVGFNPEHFGQRSKLMQLVRLIPYCERNYNLIELGPKGTGKSHIYSEFSPHGILISGGEVTVAKLFVNNASGRIGLVGYWDTVAFDEFAGKTKRANSALVDILKNYMANKSFSRGIETLGAEASMVFVGNTQHTLPYMLHHADLFDELPRQYYDSAFLDRLHFYIPGWEVDIIRGEMFSDGYGFVVDYLAEILRNLRNHDYSHHYTEDFTLLEDISTRDRTAVQKTFSGLMKIVFPHGEASQEEVEMLLRFAIEGRRRVKDQLMRIDNTYTAVQFGYRRGDGQTVIVKTLEEELYPQYYRGAAAVDEEQADALADADGGGVIELKEKHLVFKENQRGVTYDALFGPYLRGAKRIEVTDPYLRKFHQIRNFMELLETIVRHKAEGDEVEVHLVTIQDEFSESQVESFQRIKQACGPVGIQFTMAFDPIGKLHARHIVTDHGWKISLDRGLEIFQYYDMNETFDFANRLQQQRACKAFEATFLRVGGVTGGG
ncbi:MAG: BREX system Lon protease-like protein BrxL [Chloroflexi bacterium]|nr:BREX system Lon protease-like protein BrxL [Chloroflexota bacterium]MBP7045992.1 BREX system Lon protease-like protein BrxL [Chloroflexota bacterium]